MFKYGYSLNISQAAEVIFYKLPDIFITKFFGVSITGQFFQAKNFLMLVLKIPNTVLEQVLFTSLVNLKKQNSVDEYFHFIGLLTSRVMLSASWLLALLGPPIFLLLFGEQWQPAAAVLPNLAGFVFFAALFNALQSYLYSQNEQNMVTASYLIGIGTLLIITFVYSDTIDFHQLASALTISMGAACMSLYFLGVAFGHKVGLSRTFIFPGITLLVFWVMGLSPSFDDNRFLFFLIVILLVSIVEIFAASKKIIKSLGW